MPIFQTGPLGQGLVLLDSGQVGSRSAEAFDMDFHRTALFFGLALCAFAAHAETLSAPQACSLKELQLTVSNESGADADFWILARRGPLLREASESIAAHSKQILLGTDFLQPGENFFVKHDGKALRFDLKCHGEMQLSAQTSPRVQFHLPFFAGEQRLLVQNLNPAGDSKIQGRYLSRHGETLQTFDVDALSPFESSETLLSPPRGTAQIAIEGQGRLSVRMADARTGRVSEGLVPEPALLSPPLSSVYFLLADDDETESFVIHLEDPALIEQARDLLKKGISKRAIAQIEPATVGSSNRNFLAADRAPWSWNVKTVTGFADFAHISCDGFPSLLEERYSEWMNTDAGQICFWSYNLKRELSVQEVSSGKLSVP